MFSTAPLTAFMELSTAFSVRSASSGLVSQFEPDHCALLNDTLVVGVNFRGILSAVFSLYLAYLGSDP